MLTTRFNQAIAMTQGPNPKISAGQIAEVTRAIDELSAGRFKKFIRELEPVEIQRRSHDIMLEKQRNTANG